MANCVNINLPEVKELAEKLQAPIAVVGTAINIWQEKNNSDEIPKYEELKDYLYKGNEILNNNNINSNIKEGVAELFEENPELANESETSDEVMSKLLANKTIDKKCS